MADLIMLGAVGCQAAMASILFTAGLSKLPGTRIRETIVALGMPSRWSAVSAILLIGCELVAGGALAFLPGALWPRLAALALASLFAAAATWALASGRSVSCNCFNGRVAHRLGWRQLGQFPLWLAAVILASQRPVAWSVEQGAGGVALVLLLVIGYRASREAPMWLYLKGDREAVQEGLGYNLRQTRGEGVVTS